jgi:hypothetical protein
VDAHHLFRASFSAHSSGEWPGWSLPSSVRESAPAATYAPDTIRLYLRSADAFGRWLQAQGLSLTDLADHPLSRYLVHGGRRPLRSRAQGGSPRAAAALPLLLAFLRSHGVLPLPRVLPAFTPAEQWLRRFAAHWGDLRGLAPLTCQGYLFFVRRFLTASGRTKAPDWGPLQAEELSEFVRREAAGRLGGGRKRPGTALRAFVRFLVTHGAAPAGQTLYNAMWRREVANEQSLALGRTAPPAVFDRTPPPP